MSLLLLPAVYKPWPLQKRFVASSCAFSFFSPTSAGFPTENLPFFRLLLQIESNHGEKSRSL
jgi:hypothetical protein